jgi:protein gp37
MRLAARLEAMGQAKYVGLTRKTQGRNKWNGKVLLHYDALDEPKKWGRGRFVFVNSMSDMFHEDVPDYFVENVVLTIHETPQHTYQVLTKRPERMRKFFLGRNIPNNLWLGVSVESMAYWFRAEILRQLQAPVKFLSIEPMLECLGCVDLKGLDWVIVGGESGPQSRPLEADWVRNIRDRCISQRVPFHFKQWGGVNKKKTGRILDGKTWDEMPGDLNRLHSFR